MDDVALKCLPHEARVRQLLFPSWNFMIIFPIAEILNFILL